ncbi:MAG TPA: TonB C-terminal domain-containing protein [Terriglobia bacterium]|nr:TonB C-terminal domain-containing protein [Terriglobia bacterium]
MSVHRITIFDMPKERLGRSLVFSVFTHALFIASFFFLPQIIQTKPTLWGDPGAGGGGAVSVGIVRSVSGLNLPRPELTTESKVATDSKGLGKTETVKEQQVAPPPESDAFQIEQRKKPKAVDTRRPSRRPVEVAQNLPPPNVVPFGEGGTPSFSYGQFSTGTGSGGFGFNDGVFGEKYGWYVRQIRDIVSANWQKNLVDPNVRSAPRVYIQFTIQRDGTVANDVLVKQSSAIPSLDRSGERAIRASRFPPLPGGETRLVVEFWFEYSR